MSIPKEPRQLMINIMYLVLTAMLALNVSAEIFNAFKIVDKGLVKSNEALKANNAALPDAIRDGAKKKTTLAVYAERIDPIVQGAEAITAEIDEMIDLLIDQSGDQSGAVDDGDYVFKDGHVTTTLRGKKNKDATTRMLVNDGKGEEMKEKLLAFRASMLELVNEEDRASFDKEIPEIIDDHTWTEKYPNNPNYNWATFNFKQMPLQAVLPILRKFENDVISTESTMLNYLAGKVGTTTDLVVDKFTVVSAPEKTYVINGESFKTEVFLSASASKESNTGMTLKVNGTPVSINEDGVASWTQRASSVGKKSYTVEGSIKNPVTDEIQNFKKTYEYEVGERSATISASKMNVFYIGVENPVEVSVAGVASNKVKVSMGGQGGASIKPAGDGTYVVNATKPTPNGQFAKVTVSAEGFSADKNFRVKRIPDPIPTLSKKRGGPMPSGNFKAQEGIYPVLDGFDFDAKCDIAGFQVVRVPKRQDAELAINRGGRYTPEALRIVKKAVPGDKFFFENIKCKCPGDPVSRDLGTMVFNIK